MANAVAPHGRWRTLRASSSRRRSAVVGGKHDAVDVREQGLRRCVPDHPRSWSSAPGGSDEGQAVGPGFRRHQQASPATSCRRRSRPGAGPSLAAPAMAFNTSATTARSPYWSAASAERLLGVMPSEPDSTSSRDLFRQRGKIALLIIIIGHGHSPSWSNIWAKSSESLRLHRARRRRRHWRPADPATGRPSSHRRGILVQEGRDDGLARQVGEAFPSMAAYILRRLPARRRRPWKTRGPYRRIRSRSLSASKPFGIAEGDVVDQREGSACSRLRCRRLLAYSPTSASTMHLVVLAVRRVAEDAFDLAFQLARLIREFRDVLFSCCAFQCDDAALDEQRRCCCFSSNSGRLMRAASI